MSDAQVQDTTQVQQQQIKYSESLMYDKLEEEEHLNAPQLLRTDTAAQATTAGPTMAPPAYSSLDKKRKKAFKSDYSALKAESSFVSARDMESPYMQKKLTETKTINGEKVTQQQLMDRALHGDCSQLEKMDTVLRNRAATLYIKDFIKDHKDDTAEQIYNKMLLDHPNDLISAMMNPLLRAGISLIIHSPSADDAMKSKYRKLDELFNTEIMKATLTKTAASTMPDEITPVEKAKSIESQKFMMKSMLACHIGQFKKKENGKVVNWQGNVANAFTHCSRVMFIMPGSGGEDYSEEKTSKMLSSFQGNAPFFKRGGATHNLGLKRKDGTKEAKEKKSFTPFNQWGMNVAVGGIGNAGIPGPNGQTRYLKNDGSCGHLYMHLEKGDKNTHPGILLGFESDSYKHTNQQGHTHDLKATGEKASSFGGQRVDEIGDKYGGREVDLSGINEEGFAKLMDIVDQVLDKMYRDTSGAFKKDIEGMAGLLCGEIMTDSQLKDFLTSIVEIGQRYQIAMGTSAADLINGLYN